MVVKNGARSAAAVCRSENDETATTAAIRRSSAAACSATAAPMETPMTTIGFTVTRSRTRRRSCFSWNPYVQASPSDSPCARLS